MLTKSKHQPTKEQVEVIAGAIDHYAFDWIKAGMVEVEVAEDYDLPLDAMFVEVVEDGVARFAYFDRDGKLIGDWH